MRLVALALVALILSGQSSLPERITASSLQGRVSFLASDLFEGRNTPSRGLEIAADYLVSEFRRANLESPPGGEYSQAAEFLEISDHPEAVSLSITSRGEAPVAMAGDRMAVESFSAVHLGSAPVYKLAPGTKLGEVLSGKVLMLRAPAEPATVGKLALAKPAAIILLTRDVRHVGGSTRLISASAEPSGELPTLHVPVGDVERIFDRLPIGDTPARVTLNIGNPTTRVVHLRNVLGFLRGSDARLRDQCIVISAHYDHLGTTAEGTDHIFNGANDDASGVATVLELAAAFAGENPRPARTLVFVCFFGEEKGLLGSGWYVSHPLFPLKNTVANINFEQMGEPNGAEGIPAGSLAMTGFDLSNVSDVLAQPLAEAGVELRDAKHNEEYFERSDNLSFAQKGVPAHTFVAALDFPDYHRVSDEWPKLNYENMATLDRALAGAILRLANAPESPRWNEDSKKAKEYVAAWHTLHP